MVLVQHPTEREGGSLRICKHSGADRKACVCLCTHMCCSLSLETKNTQLDVLYIHTLPFNCCHGNRNKLLNYSLLQCFMQFHS